MLKPLKYAAVSLGVGLTVSLGLVSCGGNGNSSSATPVATGAALLATTQVTGISSAVSYSFDLGAVDVAAKRYYVTDRTNQSVDVFDTTTNALLSQFKNGFAGCRTAFNGPLDATCLAVAGVAVNNDASGPDGLDIVGANLFVGDVNSLKVMDKTGAPVKTIAIGGASGKRADEGCFDSVDNIYAIASPAEDPPLMTIVDAANFNVLATVYFQSAGLEACLFDATTGNFFVNNDGSTANPRGELDGYKASTFNALKATATATGPGTQYFFPGATISGTTPAAAVAFPGTTVAFPLGNCDPTGLALGPGTDIGVMCRQGNVGDTLTFQILDKTSGAEVANLVAGGGDQITFDAVSNRWFLADSRWTATGRSCGAGIATTCPLTPVLAIVDGTSRAVVARLPNGNNSHSVAVLPGVGGAPGKVFTPFTTPTAAGGGATFPNGGVNIYSTN